MLVAPSMKNSCLCDLLRGPIYQKFPPAFIANFTELDFYEGTYFVSANMMFTKFNTRIRTVRSKLGSRIIL